MLGCWWARIKVLAKYSGKTLQFAYKIECMEELQIKTISLKNCSLIFSCGNFELILHCRLEPVFYLVQKMKPFWCCIYYNWRKWVPKMFKPNFILNPLKSNLCDICYFSCEQIYQCLFIMEHPCMIPR